jgi:predicted transcriptional regulator
MINDADARYGDQPSMRALIDLSDAQICALAVLCEKVNKPRTALIREAISEYLDRHIAKTAEAAYGLWVTEAMDGLAYQERARAAW